MRTLLISSFCLLTPACVYTHAKSEKSDEHEVFITHLAPERLEPMPSPATVRVQLRDGREQERGDAYLLRDGGDLLVVPDLAPERALRIRADEVSAIDIERRASRHQEKESSRAHFGPLVVGALALSAIITASLVLAMNSAMEGFAPDFGSEDVQ